MVIDRLPLFTWIPLEVNELSESRFEKNACVAAFILAMLIAGWFRFSQIELRPFHHDEGVNSFFLLNLAHTGEYKYDPTNYHGPSLYYFAFVLLRIFGENDFALRLSPVLFGLLTVAMVWLLRRQLGTVGTPVAAFCMALSPCLVFYSRYFIHEMSFGCFSLGIVVGLWRYAQDKKFQWLAIAASSLGLLLTTKETAVITLAVFLVGIVCAAILDATKSLIQQRRFSPAALVKELKNDTVSILPSLDHALAAAIITVFIFVFFYSSAFKHWQGVSDFFRAIAHWTQERSSNDHVKIFWYYLGILFKVEFPLLIGSLLAGIFIIWRGNRFWLFTGAWVFGLALAYSRIPYKTPWLMLSFIVPMALVCGYMAEQLYRLLPFWILKFGWIIVVVFALVACGQLAWKVNFDKYDDNSNESGYFVEFGKKHELRPYIDGQYGYVYAHTDREFLALIEEIKREAESFPEKKQTGIYVASSQHWPLPWYLRDYPSTAYTGTWPGVAGEPLAIPQKIIVASAEQQSNLNGVSGWRLGSRTYKLRPGVELMLFVREEPK